MPLSEPMRRFSRSLRCGDTLVDPIFDIAGEEGYPVPVAAVRTGVSQARYESCPGRRAVIVADLTDLRGATKGMVELPLWLFWSCPDHAFDLDDWDMQLWLYQTVLREASRREDLTEYLDRETLIRLWPDLYLPKPVRQAWEERHPLLRERQESRAVASDQRQSSVD